MFYIHNGTILLDGTGVNESNYNPSAAALSQLKQLRDHIISPTKDQCGQIKWEMWGQIKREKSYCRERVQKTDTRASALAPPRPCM